MSPNPIYLHNHPEFEDLIRIVSAELDINPVLIEKDYWIMHCLYGLNELGLNYELKGGTSLSKGYGVINRFSEDIDIKLILLALHSKSMKVKTIIKMII